MKNECPTNYSHAYDLWTERCDHCGADVQDNPTIDYKEFKKTQNELWAQEMERCMKTIN